MEYRVVVLELREARRLAASLAKEVDVMNQRLYEAERKYEDIAAALGRKIAENDRLRQALADVELIGWQNKKMKYELEGQMKDVHFSILQNETVKRDLEHQRQKLVKRAKELEKQKSQVYLGPKNMLVEKEYVNNRNTVESDDHYTSMKELEEKADETQYVENLNQTLTCKDQIPNDEMHSALEESLNNQYTAQSDDHEALRKELEEKAEEIQYMESLNQTLTFKERILNDELQDAHKEAISGLKDMLNDRTTLRIKRMGEVDRRPFQEHCLRKCSGGNWDVMSAELCSLWEENVKNSQWHPFKKITIGGRLEEIIDEEDEKLKVLRNECGDEVYKAVANALLELNDYNSSGRYAVPVIWNPKEGRKCSLKEIVSYIIKQWKTNKRKRKSG